MYRLNYQHLRYFWAVSRHGNLTRASAELHLTPQTVSSQIHDLEDGLGEKLFARQGRRLVLTDIGRVVFRYADEIFNLGRELQDVVRGLPAGRPIQLAVGVADVLSKLIAHHLIEPALQMEESVHVICHEATPERLLAELAIHGLDVVLTDAPIPPAVKIRAYNHLLGECGITFMASGKLASGLRKGFPGSLDGAPFLVPVRGTALRQELDGWFSTRSIRPAIVGEFEDSALLKVFGQAGTGFFAVPSVVEDEVGIQYDVEPIGTVDEIIERFYAISVERKVQHPAVAAICDAARGDLFA
jgi:LysR family transcriptional activator of nhaA